MWFAAALFVVVGCDRGGSAPATQPSAVAPVASAAAPVASGAATATSAPSARAGTMVDIAGGARGYLAVPSAPGKHPAIVLVHEWWGLNDNIEDYADRFAKEGYVALAVDLYRGKKAKDPDEAHELMRGLPEDRAGGDLEASFRFLAARPNVEPTRIGSIGWCMGGGYSLALATLEPKLRAAVVNYGRLVTAPEKVNAIHAAVLGNFGANDRGIPPDDVHAFEGKLKDAHKDVDIKVYDGAGHAFMNPNNHGGYNEKAATDAWSRIDAFFARTLKGS